MVHGVEVTAEAVGGSFQCWPFFRDVEFVAGL